MSKIKSCVLRVGGTNCDIETKESLDNIDGIESEIVHINRMGKNRNLSDYDCLVIPGGFSYGDHIRAGAVFANRIKSTMKEELKNFAEEGGLIIGICNGFQVLVEIGLLPGLNGISEFPTAALAINKSAKYECRWVHTRNESRGTCAFTQVIENGETLYMPVAHKEGRFMLQSEREDKILDKLQKNDQIVLRYSDEDGNIVDGEYPKNPNGSLNDIAGICDPSGRIFGLMPHPERAYYGTQLPNWTRMKEVPEYGDGKLIFESIVRYLE